MEVAHGELAGVGGFFLFNFSIPMGIEFLIKKGSLVNFVNNLLKRICKNYNLNNDKKRLTTTQYTYSNNNRRKQNMAERGQLTLHLTQVDRHN